MALSSCKVDVRLDVRVGENGSGVVQARFTLDREALEAVGGNLETALAVDDLVAAGWHVDVEPNGGGAEVTAERGFGDPADLTRVIGELSGERGPFRGFRLTRKHSAFRTSFAFRGGVDLADGVGPTLIDPSDAIVSAEAEHREVEVDEIRDYLLEQLDGAVTVEVTVALPGRGAHNAPGTRAGEPRWAPTPGDVVALSADSSVFELDRAVLVAIGGLLAAAALFTLLRRREETTRRRASSP